VAEIRAGQGQGQGQGQPRQLTTETETGIEVGKKGRDIDSGR
jgi:hypothetical protein